VTTSSQFLEINSDTQINGSLSVRDSINGLGIEATPSASIEAKPSPQPTPSPTPSPSPSPEQEATPSAVTTPQSGKLNSQSTASSSATPSPNPSPNPQPQPTPALSFWNINADGSTTTINPVSLGVTYKAPQNDKVSLTFTKLPENAGTVTVKEHEAPPTVENAGSKDYEITSSMPNGSFEFDLTLPTNDPNKTVLSSQDGQNYTPITNEKITTADTITIKGITHLTHFIVGTEDEDEFDHPLINEFMPHPSSGNDWIELYNPTNHKISLVGWKLNDINVTPMRNLTGTILAKGFAVFEVSDRLNNGGDSIFLNDPRGTTFDSRSYNLDPGIDKSIGRTPNGGPTWTTFNTATKGVSNGASLDTLYVDANWFDSDNDGGHNWGFDAFSRIQDAINFAPAGATINVAAGQFSENLIINKSLALLGPGLEATQSAKIIMPGNGEEDTCDRLVSIDEANNVTVQGFFMDGGRCGSPVIWVDQSLGSKLLANDITGGSNGIELTSSSSKTTISGNNIHANDSGIIVQRAATNLARSNSIFGNEIGVDNQDTTARFDASSNWWGQASGPTHTTNSSGTGDSISGNVKYRPFYTDAARTTLSSTTIGAGNFSPAPFFLSGIFSLPSGTTSQTNTPSVTINQETIFTAVAGLGISSVKLPFGVVIQRVGGGTLNASLLKIENALPASLQDLHQELLLMVRCNGEFPILALNLRMQAVIYNQLLLVFLWTPLSMAKRLM